MGTHTLTVGSENGDVGSTISYITINLPDSPQWHSSRTAFLENDARFGEAFEHHCNNGKHYLRTVTHLKGADGLSIRLDNQTCVAYTPAGQFRGQRRQKRGQNVVSGLRALFSKISTEAGGVNNEDYRDHAGNFGSYDREDPTCGHIIRNTSSVRRWHHRCVETLRCNIEKSYRREFGNQKRHYSRNSVYEACSDDEGSMICLHENLGVEPQNRRAKQRRSFSSRFVESEREAFMDNEQTAEDEHMALLLRIRWDRVWKKAKRISLSDIWSHRPGPTSSGQNHASRSSQRVTKASTNETAYYGRLSNEGSLSPPPRPRHSSLPKVSKNPTKRATEFKPPIFEFEYFDVRDPRTPAGSNDHLNQQYNQRSAAYDPTKYDSLMSDMVSGLDQFSSKAFGQANCHLFVCIPDPIPDDDALPITLEETTATQTNPTDTFPFPRPTENWKEVVKATMDIGWSMTGDDKIGRVPLATMYNLLVDARAYGKTEMIFEAAGRDYLGRPLDRKHRSSGDGGSCRIPKVYPQFTVDETFPFDPTLKSKAIDDVIERVLDSVQDLSFEALMWMQTYALWTCKSMAVRMGQSIDHMKDLNWEYVSALDRMTLAIWLLLRLRRNRHASRVYSRVTMMRGDWDAPEVGQDSTADSAATSGDAEPSSATEALATAPDCDDGVKSSSPQQEPSTPQPPSPPSPSSPPPSTDPQPATSSRAIEASRKQTYRLDPFVYAYNSRLSPSTKLPKSVDHLVPVRNSSSSQSSHESATPPVRDLLLDNDKALRCSIGDVDCGCGRGVGDGNNGGLRVQRAFRTTIRPASAYIATVTRGDEATSQDQSEGNSNNSSGDNGSGDGDAGIALEAKKVVTFNSDVVMVSHPHKADEVTTDQIETETDSIQKRRGNDVIEGKTTQKKSRRVSNPHTAPDPVATQASAGRTEYLADLCIQSSKAKAAACGAAAAAANAGISARGSKNNLNESAANSSDTIALVKTDTNTSVKSKDSSVTLAEFDDQLFPGSALSVLNNLTFSPPQVQTIIVTCCSCPREFEISYLHQQEDTTTYAKHVAQCSQPSPSGQSRLTKVKAALVSRVKKQGE